VTLAAELAYIIAAPCPAGARWPNAAALLAHLQPRNVDPIPPRPGPGLEKTFVELANPAVPGIEIEDDPRGWFTTASLRVASGTVAEVAQVVGALRNTPRSPGGGQAEMGATVDRGTHTIRVRCFYRDEVATRVDLMFERKL